MVSTAVRRSLPLLVLACALLVGCSDSGRTPDVILLTLDTTRADHLGAYGYRNDTSPNIDAFARDAVLFRRAWSTAPWTLPAHASMVTGKHPTSHGGHFVMAQGNAALRGTVSGEKLNLRVNRIDEREVTLAEILRDRGYSTAAFAGGPWLAPSFGLLQGYEVQDAGKADNADFGGRRAEELTDAAIRWLADVPRGPLHLLVNYFDPHAPYRAPDHVPTRGAFAASYDAEIRYMDGQIGRLLDALRAAGRYEDALIIMISDHGELLGEHGLSLHGHWLYEELMRVPLLVRFPGGRDAGSEIDAPVSVVDLLPLIAQVVGFELPAGVEGQPIGTRQVVLGEIRRDARSIRMNADLDRDLRMAIRWPWKLIQSDRGERELYRLDVDPHESNNLTGDSAEEQRLLEDLRMASERIAPPTRQATESDVSPETLESLRGLGYIE